MNIRKMNIFTAHCDKYFQQSDCTILHPTEDTTVHIDVLVYPPNGKFPFWKLVTMGVSDYKMPKAKQTLGNRNEYMMFISGQENLRDPDTLSWYREKLLMIATYSMATQTPVSYGHSMEWEPEEQESIVGAFLEMPQIIEDVGMLRCKLGPFRTCICLQAVLLTRDDLQMLLSVGPQQFSSYLYPEDGRPHYLSQRTRTEQF